ncbi:conserved membrane hypothetical protein [Verrucomicrobia bacterium]|nr:conserved membrane hypothetical protein [Verrucomicrobiota bacterium]
MIRTKHSPYFRLFLSLLASVVIGVVGLFLVRFLVPASWLHANNEVAGNYLQTLGTIYAVLLAFVVFVVWQQHNETRSAVESEANELSDLYRTVQALPGTQQVKARLQTYGRQVVEEEWAAMARGCWSQTAEQTLEEVWQALQAVAPSGGRQEALYAEALARFNDLSDARSHRLYCSLLRLPPSLWVLLLTNGGLVIGSMWIFGMESFSAHALMTVALAGSIAFMLFLIADLDNPFWGSWRIGPDAFERALGHSLRPSP